MTDTPFCDTCGEPYNPDRAKLGHTMCLDCGEAAARKARERWCIAPVHKSNYQLISDRRELIGLNNKGGLVK